MSTRKHITSFFLLLIFCLQLAGPAFAAGSADLDAAVQDVVSYVYRTTPTPQVGSIGGEWAILGLARSGQSIPDAYYQTYAATVKRYVTAAQGTLHEQKYTEYARLVLALTAIGINPRQIAGYSMLTPLGDFEKTMQQGLNGPIMALIALDSSAYPMPQNPNAQTQATRARYVQAILEAQLPDGGWTLLGNDSTYHADPDLTGMALQALSAYQSDASVKAAIEKALTCLSALQNAAGGFSSWGVDNCESTAQVLVGLCSLGIPLEDARFVKNGQTVLDALLRFYRPGNGFLHTIDGSGSNQMASEQGLYALVAAQRARDQKPKLYQMTDALHFTESTVEAPSGLAAKHQDVKAQPLTQPKQTFSDIQTHANRTAIESLASRSIINGFQDGLFHPDDGMSRAEFATIVVKALGLPTNTDSTSFADVAENDWFASYVGSAQRYGIVSGTSQTHFSPQGTITREEAATMVARAAKLCGLDTTYDTMSARDSLAQFSDYVTCSTWSLSALAFCYDTGLLDDSAVQIQPKRPILRSEVAQMLSQMLSHAALL